LAAPKKPKGAKSDKEWRDMIRLTVNELRADPKSGKKTKALRQLAGRLVEKALGGDVAALKEIGDRLDGKPAQAVELGGRDGEDLSFTITFVKPVDG